MVVIAGYRRRRHPVTAVEGVCPMCHRESVRVGIVEKRAATVFWIPIIPLGSRKTIVCLMCGGAEKVKSLAPLPFPEVPPEQIRARLAEIRAQQAAVAGQTTSAPRSPATPPGAPPGSPPITTQ